MTLITSVQNPLVKHAVQLHRSRCRQEAHLILIEGRHPIEEALTAGVSFETIFIREGEDGLKDLPETIETHYATASVMARLATTDTSPPFVAIAQRPRQDIQGLLGQPSVSLLGLVDLQDPGNVGTLVRSACAFGIEGILSIGTGVDVYHPKVIRASAGLVFRMPTHHFVHLDAVIQQLEIFDSPISIWGTHAHDGLSYRQVQYPTRRLWLMGSEAHGLPDGVWAHAQPVHIPMAAGVESLNVAMAGTIILADAFHR